MKGWLNISKYSERHADEDPDLTVSRSRGSDSASIPPQRYERPTLQKSSFILAEMLLSDIVAGELQPGDPLPAEREMVEVYGMGRGTVREALRLLEYQGAIQIRPGLHGGPFMNTPNSTHFANTIGFLMQVEGTPFRAVVEVRSAIEPMIGRLAAERINDEALAELRRTTVEMRRIIAKENTTVEFSELNTRFHNVIAWSSGNPLFRHLADSLLDIMDGVVIGMRYTEESRQGVVSAHETILSALEARDPERVSRSMTKHLDEWERYVSDNFPDSLSETVPWTSLRDRRGSMANRSRPTWRANGR